ncbi:hypothetical protein MNB_SV-14-537 [hydrothermal vent metagenome]|uniref:Uncharacterized protein n=1 Tax=hydrothermal vent metagenome TaxID=652676 RepID=A0A1W1CU98_9ZZZZ
MRPKIITLMVSLTIFFANASNQKHLIKTNLTYYTTDLTKEGTHPLDKNDSFKYRNKFCYYSNTIIKLWLSPNKDDNKTLSFLGKLPNNNWDSDIFVTDKFIYFYSKDDMPSKMLYIKNAKVAPKKIKFGYFNLPKKVFDIIADNKNLYFLDSKGFVYRVDGTKISDKPINKTAIEIKNRTRSDDVINYYNLYCRNIGYDTKQLCQS